MKTDRKPRRIGDVTESVIHSVVPKVLLDKLGEDCGCAERRDRMNYWHTQVIINATAVTKSMQVAINSAAEQLFGEKWKFTTCGQCLRGRIIRLNEKLKQLEREQAIQQK